MKKATIVVCAALFMASVATKANAGPDNSFNWGCYFSPISCYFEPIPWP